MQQSINATVSPFIGIPAAHGGVEERKPDTSGLPLCRLEGWKLKSAPYQLLLEWSHVKGLSKRSIQIGFECIIEQCLATEVDEFVVEDIVPGHTPGVDDPSIVLETEAKIVKIFQEASMSHFRKSPVCRLSLRHKAFDIRIYLGRTLPFDRVFPEDGFGLDDY